MDDLVKRLRARKWLHAPCADSKLDREAADRIEAQAAEIARLRNALLQIATLEMPAMTAAVLVEVMRDEARQALKGGEESPPGLTIRAS